MKLKQYVYLWVLIAIFLSFEHFAINHRPALSILSFLKSKAFLDPDLEMTTFPGKPISYLLGWLGFGIMLLTNFYVLRKRFGFMKNFGTNQRWLDTHIFFGIVGPLFIVFHSDFKVGGLVAISFWSMIIAALSGVIGRYFYINAAQSQGYWRKQKKKWEEVFVERNKSIDHETLESFLASALVKTGGGLAVQKATILSLPKLVIVSLWSDFLMLFSGPRVPAGGAPESALALRKFGLAHRRVLYIESYRKLLGYWHAFHMPFTILMYIAAVLHIAAALVFSVK